MMKHLFVFVACIVATQALTQGRLVKSALADLPPCQINMSAISVSGLSAGAFMAVQFHVAYSKTVMAAGIIAGGPYYCAQDEFTYAVVECMTEPDAILVEGLIAKTDGFARSGQIDDTSNLAKTSVWLYSGTKDTVVKTGVMEKLKTFYQHYITEGVLDSDFTQASEHGWPTLDYGLPCGRLGSPYILKCDYDAAGKVLKNAYPDLKPPGTAISSNLISFSQAAYGPATLADIGYVYVPSACRQNSTGTINGGCKLHVAFHGCEQSVEFVKDVFAANTGLNAYAESNNIVVLYPQSGKDILKENPNGCWDWWGYTGSDYCVQKGKQMAAVKAMIDKITGA